MMKNFDKLDGQMLGAFVDGHLDPEHSDAVIKAMHDDPDIREQVYQLRRAKDLMKLAFADAQAPSGSQQQSGRYGRRIFTTRIAASVAALAISFGAGALGHQYYNGQTAANSESMTASVQEQTDKIILHISESDPKQFMAALDYAKTFLADHDSNSQIDVVAHAGGLDLMRADVSPLKNQIIAMMDKYPNVHFIACAGAIRMFQKKNGVKPVIIDGIATDETAFDHIVGRLQSGGWKYIKVETITEI